MRNDKNQFSLPFTATKCSPKKRRAGSRVVADRGPAKIEVRDQLLNTRDVERITQRHRCTIYRWVRAGTFPGKRAGGGRGWLQSDVEQWLWEHPRISHGDLRFPHLLAELLRLPVDACETRAGRDVVCYLDERPAIRPVLRK